ERNLCRFRLRVLPQMTFPRFEVQLANFVRAAEHVQRRPAVAILDRVVRPIVAAPALDAFETAALVEILAVELGTRLGAGLEDFSLQKSPGRWAHRGGNLQYFLLRNGHARERVRKDKCKAPSVHD